MEHLAALLVLAIGLFVATNLDDIFVLVGFFSEPKYRPRQIAAGQLAGLAALYGASVACALLALAIPAAWVGFLGLLPIAIGLKKMWELRQPDEGDDLDAGSRSAGARGNILAVAAVTIANGGDNLSIYVPTFATRPAFDVAAIGIVFAAMTLAWVGAACWLTGHRTLGKPIRHYGRRLVPFVLVALGFTILHEAGTLALLRGWA